MIQVTRINGEALILNANLIETIEATPDTVISMVTGKKMMVRESVEVVVQRALEYQQQIGHPTVIPSIPQQESAYLPFEE